MSERTANPNTGKWAKRLVKGVGVVAGAAMAGGALTGCTPENSMPQTQPTQYELAGYHGSTLTVDGPSQQRRGEQEFNAALEVLGSDPETKVFLELDNNGKIVEVLVGNKGMNPEKKKSEALLRVGLGGITMSSAMRNGDGGVTGFDGTFTVSRARAMALFRGMNFEPETPVLDNIVEVMEDPNKPAILIRTHESSADGTVRDTTRINGQYVGVER